MKILSRDTFFVIFFCLSFCIINISAQKNRDEVELRSEPVEVKSAPVEIRNEPPPSPPPVESSPVYQAPEPEPIKVETSREVYRESSKNEPKNDSPPNPPVNPSQPPVVITVDRDKRPRDAMKNSEKKDKNNKDKYENCPYYDPYGNCTYTPNDTTYTNSSYVNPNSFFNGDDLAILNYKRFVQKNSASYLPYFAGVLGDNFKPLYTVGIVEPQADLPYVTPFWVFYYEPQLDNFFIDFSKFNYSPISTNAPVKFERLIVTAADNKTIRKNGKKFDYNGKVRPILVEDISGIAADRIYTFNIAYLPKGEYELQLISKTGDTAKLKFKLK